MKNFSKRKAAPCWSRRTRSWPIGWRLAKVVVPKTSGSANGRKNCCRFGVSSPRRKSEDKRGEVLKKKEKRRLSPPDPISGMGPREKGDLRVMEGQSWTHGAQAGMLEKNLESRKSHTPS